MIRTFALGLAGGVALGASIAALGQDAKPSTMAFMKTMEAMMTQMHVQLTGDADQDFASMMLPHTQAAIEMAKTELEFGKDPGLREFAQKIVDTQERDIKVLYDWLILSQADHHH